MKKSDRELGMFREINRRDFVSGTSIAIAAAALVPGDVGAQRGAMPGWLRPHLQSSINLRARRRTIRRHVRGCGAVIRARSRWLIACGSARRGTTRRKQGKSTT